MVYVFTGTRAINCNSSIMTGFSFGGLLAAALTAHVWETPYFPAALLKQNLVCITFGQPHVTVPMLESAAAQNPELASCIHSFYCEDDPVPRLLRVLDRSWSQEDTHKEKSHVVLPMDVSLLTDVHYRCM